MNGSGCSSSPVLPTPSATLANDGETLESWEARRARVRALGYNGNGMGDPLGIALNRLAAETFPTPAARDGKGRTNPVGRERPNGRVRGQEDLTLPEAVQDLLPTPRASARENRTTRRTPSQERGEHGRYLATEVQALFDLPAGAAAAAGPPALFSTPTARDAASSRNSTAERYGGRKATTGNGHTLTDQLAPRGWSRVGVREFPGWGKYTAAVERWETVEGVRAPVPLQPSPARKHRVRLCAHATGLDGWAATAALELGLWGLQLRPEFSEWLMGIPAGRVTAVPGLSRNDQLRIIGNGVVFRQALAAITELDKEQRS